MSSRTDKAFRYVPSHSTDIRRTFARVRRQARDAREQGRAEAPAGRYLPLLPRQLEVQRMVDAQKGDTC